MVNSSLRGLEGFDTEVSWEGASGVVVIDSFFVDGISVLV